MSEFRRDPITGRWVIVAQERLARPLEFSPAVADHPAGPCPFCEGHEDQTPPEITGLRAAGSQPNQPGWRVRVVPNKFPAVQADAVPCGTTDDLYERMPGIGAHEVIVESPNHVASTSELTDEQVGEVFSVYRDRLIRLRTETRFVYGLVFKNVGYAAGASVQHTHSQLIATPIMPLHVREELETAKQYFQQRGRCIFCALIEREECEAVRVIDRSSNFIVLCPFASRVPYETWILPTSHASHIEDIKDHAVFELGKLVKQTISQLETTTGGCAYNYLIHTAPLDSDRVETYHWHIEVFPRLAKAAGFEWGTGYFINPIAPEDAAGRLRPSPHCPPDASRVNL